MDKHANSASDASDSGLFIVARNLHFPLFFNRILTVGRKSDENILIIRHPTVSRRHARIQFDNGHFGISDLGSTNGTLINGKHVANGVIKSGDSIGFGDVEVMVKGEQIAEPVVMQEAFEDPSLTQIIDLEFAKLDEKSPAIEKQLMESLRRRIQEERRHLQDLAFRDGLTGLFSRRYFDIEIKRQLQGAQRHQRSLALLLIDVDYFKKFNDSFGHQAGDEALKWVGTTILQKLRDTDVAARYGGEEMAVVLPEITSDDALKVAEKVRLGIADSSSASFPRQLTVSVGVAIFPEHADTVEQLINRADQALYQAKSEGRNRSAIAALRG
jgi:diguanylate cyclase (GGDEF)-like protein